MALRLEVWAACISLALTLFGCGTPNCSGSVQKDLKFGCDQHLSLADDICCHNTDFAESSGFFESVGPNGQSLFAQLDAAGITTFYDSTCGLPLFKAPIGRSFSDWQTESQGHGWPSFRSAEAVKENLVFKSGGEMQSKCGTHLGHNLPDFSGDRYCIDLVCIAGKNNSTRTPTVSARPSLV